MKRVQQYEQDATKTRRQLVELHLFESIVLFTYLTTSSTVDVYISKSQKV